MRFSVASRLLTQFLRYTVLVHEERRAVNSKSDVVIYINSDNRRCTVFILARACGHQYNTARVTVDKFSGEHEGMNAAPRSSVAAVQHGIIVTIVKWHIVKTWLT